MSVFMHKPIHTHPHTKGNHAKHSYCRAVNQQSGACAWLKYSNLVQEYPPGSPKFHNNFTRLNETRTVGHLLPQFMPGTHWCYSWLGCFPSRTPDHQVAIIQLGGLEQCDYLVMLHYHMHARTHSTHTLVNIDIPWTGMQLKEITDH